jgi:hypothetical protein
MRGMEATPPPQPPGGGYGQPPGQPGGAQPPGAPGGGYGQSPYPQAPPPPGGGGKLDTAGTFERIFQLYGSQFAIFIGAALLVFLPIALLQGVAIDQSSIGLLLLASLLSLVANAFYTGMVVEAVRDMRDGKRDHGIGDLFGAAAPFIVPLILAGIVFAIGFVIGLILIVIPGLIFATWFCLFAPAIVVERQGVFGALQRSRDLVRGNAWRVFGVVLVVVVVVGVINNIMGRLGLSISDGYVGALIGNWIGSVITAPFFALAVSVMYFQLRDAREGTQGLAAPAPPPQV